MRNIAFSLTTAQVRARTKDVTRRAGWCALTAGTLLCAVEKGMGLKRGQRVSRLGVIRVTEVRREPLVVLTTNPSYGAEEMRREGFPGLAPQEFIDRFMKRGVGEYACVTRIEFEYVDEEVGNG